MAKIIKITQEYLTEIRKDFEETLKTAKLSDGKISFSRSFMYIKRDATVFFVKEAWQKMQALINGFDKEVAWHGLAYRGEEGKDEYFITDILVYPQEVTGATVTTDQEKYQMWLMSHDDDVFNNIRMQGHSHVNMGVTPSGVDNSLYERILEQLDDGMFYIFLIYNKKGDKIIKIYDFAKNILFETSDVTVKILEEDADDAEIHLDSLSDEENKALTDFLAEFREKKRVDEFIKSAMEMVKDRATAPIALTQTTPAKREGVVPKTIDKKRKGKRKRGRSGSSEKGGQQLAFRDVCGYDDDDDWDSSYSELWYSDEYMIT